MSEPARHHHLPSVGLWFGVLAGPLAWAVHLGLSYLWETTRCVNGLSMADLFLHGTSLVTLLIVVAAGFIAWSIFRDTASWEDVPHTERVRFMALSGVLLNVAFGAVIVVGALPVFFLEHCA
jgi:hypothetical protein